MTHQLTFSTDERDRVILKCDDPHCDWSAIVGAPDRVHGLVTEHNESLRRNAEPGLYIRPSGRRGYQPTVFRRDADGRWWQTEAWREALGVDVASIVLVGVYAEEDG